MILKIQKNYVNQQMELFIPEISLLLVMTSLSRKFGKKMLLRFTNGKAENAQMKFTTTYAVLKRHLTWSYQSSTGTNSKIFIWSQWSQFQIVPIFSQWYDHKSNHLESQEQEKSSVNWLMSPTIFTKLKFVIGTSRTRTFSLVRTTVYTWLISVQQWIMTHRILIALGHPAFLHRNIITRDTFDLKNWLHGHLVPSYILCWPNIGDGPMLMNLGLDAPKKMSHPFPPPRKSFLMRSYTKIQINEWNSLILSILIGSILSNKIGWHVYTTYALLSDPAYGFSFFLPRTFFPKCYLTTCTEIAATHAITWKQLWLAASGKQPTYISSLFAYNAFFPPTQLRSDLSAKN